MITNSTLIIAILTTLAGPILTLIITNYYQSRQKQKEHNNSLQAIWFTKKLNAAEVITAQFSLLLASIFHLKFALKKIKLDESDIPVDEAIFDVGAYLNNEARKGLEKSSNLDAVLANTLSLYFHVPEARSLRLQKLATSLYEIVPQIVKNFNLAFDSESGSIERREYNDSIDLFISKYEELKTEIEGQINKLRDSFKGYDL